MRDSTWLCDPTDLAAHDFRHQLDSLYLALNSLLSSSHLACNSLLHDFHLSFKSIHAWLHLASRSLPSCLQITLNTNQIHATWASHPCCMNSILLSNPYWINSTWLSNPCTIDSTWPRDPSRPDCTHRSTPIRSISHGLQLLTELFKLCTKFLTTGIPFVVQIHAWVTPLGFAIPTGLIAHTCQH